MLLPILFWIILVLCVIGLFLPDGWSPQVRFAPSLALFIIIGLKLFRVALLLMVGFTITACETIPVNAKACYYTNGVRVCTTYNPTSGVGVEADFKSGK